MEKRRSHWLGKNEGSQFPSRFVFVDTETTPENLPGGAIKHSFRLAVAAYVRRRGVSLWSNPIWGEFAHPEAFWGFLLPHLHRKTRTYLISHFIPFDFPVLGGFPMMERLGFRWIDGIMENRRIFMEFEYQGAKLVIMDNMNIWNCSLSALGDLLQIDKMEMPKFEEPHEKWFPYCRRDVEILIEGWKVWEKFLRTHDFGSFGFIRAGQAFKAYRHRFMPKPVGIHTNQGVIELERKAYKGGRSECFRLGGIKQSPIFVLDVNSLYPYIMRSYLYPYNLIGHTLYPSPDRFETHLESHCVIAHCSIKTKTPIYPLHLKNRLIFPVGSFEAHLTTEEIKEAIRRGDLVRIHEAVYYEKIDLFSKWVNELYEMRIEYKTKGNLIYSTLMKDLMNSLYGKFGQKREVWEKVKEGVPDSYGSFSEYHAQTGVMRWFRIIDHTLYQKTGESEGFNSFPAIAAEVTANARLYLWSLIEKAGRNNVFYCDTDSLFTNEAGFIRLKSSINPHHLGSLKLEKTAQSLTLYGLKDYVLDGAVKLKGVRSNAVKIDETHYKQYHSPSLISTLSTHEGFYTLWNPIEKELTRKYSKGKPTQSGRVYPFSLP